MTTLEKLQKKLVKLQAKLSAFVRLNSRKLAGKTALEITQIEGEIEKLPATTPSTTEKYTWTLYESWGNCHNNENGNDYSVSQDCCTCLDWYHRRRKTGENCKHQDLYESLLNQIEKSKPKEILIDEKDCPTGTWLRRTDEWMWIEYEVWCYREKYNPRYGFEIQQACIGRITQGKNEISAGTLRSIPRNFTSTENAINYLIRYNGLEPSKVAEIYYKQHPQQAYSEPEPEPEQPTKKQRTWLSVEDLISSSLAI